MSSATISMGLLQVKFGIEAERNVLSELSKEDYPVKETALRSLNKLETILNEPEKRKNIAIWTGVGGLVALVAAVAVTIIGFFIPFIGFTIAASCLGLASAGLGFGSRFNSSKSLKVREALEDDSRIKDYLNRRMGGKPFGLKVLGNAAQKNLQPLIDREKTKLVMGDPRFQSLFNMLAKEFAERSTTHRLKLSRSSVPNLRPTGEQAPKRRSSAPDLLKV